MLTINSALVVLAACAALLVWFVALAVKPKKDKPSAEADGLSGAEGAITEITPKKKTGGVVFFVIASALLLLCAAAAVLAAVTSKNAEAVLRDSATLKPLISFVDLVNQNEMDLTFGSIKAEDFVDLNDTLPRSGFVVTEPYLVIQKHPKKYTLDVKKCDGLVFSDAVIESVGTVIYVDPELGYSGRYSENGTQNQGFENIISYEYELYYFDAATGEIIGYEVIPARAMPEKVSSRTSYITPLQDDVYTAIKAHIAAS